MLQMTNFNKIFSQKPKGKPVLSLEFFPPKQAENLQDTIATVGKFAEFQPDFMTCTYGAGGGTREFTGKIVEFIAQNLNIPAVAHLTCVGHSITEIDQVLDRWKELGVKNILALRGDPPKDANVFVPPSDGFSCARDLAAHISKRGDFSIAVAGYPEVHPEAVSADAELEYLREKVDAGAELIVTQLFFDTDLYLRFLEKTRKLGIEIPIIPGIMPVSNLKQVKRFTSMCGASIPEEFLAKLESFKDNQDALTEYGTEYAIKMCEKLLLAGAPGLHLYTLNKSKQIDPILREFS